MKKSIKKLLGSILITTLSTAALSGCASKQETAAETVTEAVTETGTEETTAPEPLEATAVYLGVKNYGAEETNKENIDQFQYRFEIDGKETLLSIQKGTDENNPYPIQNALKEGYSYQISYLDDIVTAVSEVSQDFPVYTPPVSGIAGEKTLENFLKTAMMPVGTALYVYGGAWDWQDEGSSIQSKTIGLSPDWIKFFQEQDENYTYRDKDGDEANQDPQHSYYPYGQFNEYYYAGIDCSAYIAWTLYNTLNTDNTGEGLVSGSTGFAKKMADMGLGTWTQDVKAPDGTEAYTMKPGDIMSINGHVWMSLGTCSDNSVVIAHSTPNKSRTGQPGGGVQIGAIGTTEDCEAYLLADHYMSTYYPEWYKRYPVCLKNAEDYFSFEGEKAGLFRWDLNTETGFSDPDGYQSMTPEEVLKHLFNEA